MTERPIFLMASSPNRMPSGVTVKTISLWLISGGSTGISSRAHSSMYSISLAVESSTLVISAAMYSLG